MAWTSTCTKLIDRRLLADRQTLTHPFQPSPALLMNKTVNVPAFSPPWTGASSTRGCLGRQVRSSSWREALTLLHIDAEYMSEPVLIIQECLTWGRRPYMSMFVSMFVSPIRATKLIANAKDLTPMLQCSLFCSLLVGRLEMADLVGLSLLE